MMRYMLYKAGFDRWGQLQSVNYYFSCDKTFYCDLVPFGIQDYEKKIHGFYMYSCINPVQKIYERSKAVASILSSLCLKCHL